MVESKDATLSRSTSLKLFSKRNDSCSSPTSTVSDSRSAVDLQRTPSRSSRSSSSSSTSSSASTLSSTSSSSKRTFCRKQPSPLVIRASTFEWSWNWDDLQPHHHHEFAPSFPSTLAAPPASTLKPRSDYQEVSPRSSTILPRLTRLPNHTLGDWLDCPTASRFSDDEDDEEQERVERVERSVLPSITVSAPSEKETANNRSHTFRIRRKPPPAYIEVTLPSKMSV